MLTYKSIGIGQIETLLNYIDKYKKRTTFFREEIYRLNKKADKLQKELDNSISKDKIRTEIKELEEILEKRKTIDIIEEINRLEELLGDDE